MVLFRLTNQLFVGEALAYDLRYRQAEAVGIVHVDTIVKAERLFVNIAEQVERLNADVGAVDAALQETPEILHAIGVNVLANILHGMVNDLMSVFVRESPVGLQEVAINVRSGFHVVTYQLLQFALLASPYDLGADLTAAFQNGSDNGLTFGTATVDLFGLLVGVHVTGLAADEGFVYFDFTAELATVVVLMGQTYAMEHEPSGLLSNPKCATYFVAGDAVLAIGDEPNTGQPFIKTERGVFKDRTDLDGKLTLRMARRALPAELIFQEAYLRTSAGRASYAIGPTADNDVVQAVLGNGEKGDCFLKCLRSVGFHNSIVTDLVGLVKYIFTIFDPRKLVSEDRRSRSTRFAK